MSKINIAYQINHLSPFDTPTGSDVEKFICGEDSVHISSAVTPKSDGTGHYVLKEFGRFLDTVIARGGIRKDDYLITLRNKDEKFLLTLHTTHDFISIEDGDGWVRDE